jgi:cysteine-rich repeat protein
MDMHLGTRVLVVATSAVILLACGDGGVLREEHVSSTSDAVVVVDYDGTFTLSWNVNPGPNQGGYAYLSQRFNGGAWTSIYYTGLGPQSRTVTVTQYGVYEHKVTYAYMPQNPCGDRYCVPGLVGGSLTLQTVHFVDAGGQGGSAGASGGSGNAGSSGSAGQGGMSGGTAGTGGTACTSNADCPAGRICAGGTCVGFCGNGLPDPGEECDDGNSTSADGCEPDCTSTG